MKYTIRTAKKQEECYRAGWYRGSIAGDYLEAVGTMLKPKGGIKRLDKEHYLVISTGEVKEYQSREDDIKHIKSLKRTMAKLMQLFRANFCGGINELFVTLTYRENMTDSVQLMKDWDKFYKRLRYAYPDKDFAYIAVAEPQERGAWHFHVLLKDLTGHQLYIPNQQLQEIWGHGYTDAERVRAEDAGLYFATYLTYIGQHKWEREAVQQSEQQPSEQQQQRKFDKMQSKIAKKTSRLPLYPKHFKYYRASRNLIQPQAVELSSEVVEQLFPHEVGRYSCDIVDEDGNVVQRVERITRSKRKPRSKPQGNK